jgi:phage terminase large subunit-like protein
MQYGEPIAADLYRHENMLLYWTHEMKAPWQRPQWVEDQKRTLRPAQFARLILNQWTSSESTFIELSQWDACVDPELAPLLARSGYPIFAGLDLGLRHDSTALLACSWDGDRIRLVTHQVFTPSEGETLDIEQTAEAAVLSLARRFALISCHFDPWQGISLSQRLIRQGVNMVEWPQTPANLSLMAGNLLELIKRRQFASYQAPDLRDAVAKTVAIEGSRGWRLGKAKASDRVDPVISLAMACYAAVQAGRTEPIAYYPALPQPSGFESFVGNSRGFSYRNSQFARLDNNALVKPESAQHDALVARQLRRWGGRWRGAGF